MKPTVPVALDAALREVKDMIKTETDARKRMNLISLVTVLIAIRRDWDSAAASRVEDIEAMTNIFKRGAELAPEPLRQSLSEAVNQAEQNRGDLRMSALDATLDRLKAVLIDLQIWLESNASEEGQALLEEVYSFLKRRASRLAMLKKMW
ncbi:hypothetical protein IT084_15180 [Desulfallas sp. Bu1-1]|uniref:hypothetical protein n=1 Tax=Desulfallas sp. Bu1-1 TaxID=2787620 RepID=UPI00189E1E37|nr:hypothetical protein [Desulfallas sp. Bu1-1]MBF7084295.1 hypothetical protein [Desulfallas sp. Bu1-1]